MRPPYKKERINAFRKEETDCRGSYDPRNDKERINPLPTYRIDNGRRGGIYAFRKGEPDCRGSCDPRNNGRNKQVPV